MAAKKSRLKLKTKASLLTDRESVLPRNSSANFQKYDNGDQNTELEVIKSFENIPAPKMEIENKTAPGNSTRVVKSEDICLLKQLFMDLDRKLKQLPLASLPDLPLYQPAVEDRIHICTSKTAGNELSPLPKMCICQKRPQRPTSLTLPSSTLAGDAKEPSLVQVSDVQPLLTSSSKDYLTSKCLIKTSPPGPDNPKNIQLAVCKRAVTMYEDGKDRMTNKITVVNATTSKDCYFTNEIPSPKLSCLFQNSRIKNNSGCSSATVKSFSTQSSSPVKTAIGSHPHNDVSTKEHSQIPKRLFASSPIKQSKNLTSVQHKQTFKKAKMTVSPQKKVDRYSQSKLSFIPSSQSSLSSSGEAGSAGKNKDIVEEDVRNNVQKDESHRLVSNNLLTACPLCQIQFKPSETQLEIDSHIASCLAASEGDVIW